PGPDRRADALGGDLPRQVDQQRVVDGRQVPLPDEICHVVGRAEAVEGEGRMTVDEGQVRRGEVDGEGTDDEDGVKSRGAPGDDLPSDEIRDAGGDRLALDAEVAAVVEVEAERRRDG